MKCRLIPSYHGRAAASHPEPPRVEERNCHSWEVYKYPRNMSQEYQQTITKAFESLCKPFKVFHTPEKSFKAWVVTSTSRRCAAASTTTRWRVAMPWHRSGRWHSARRCSAVSTWSRSTAAAWPCSSTTSRCRCAMDLPAMLLTMGAAGAA